MATSLRSSKNDCLSVGVLSLFFGGDAKDSTLGGNPMASNSNRSSALKKFIVWDFIVLSCRIPYETTALNWSPYPFSDGSFFDLLGFLGTVSFEPSLQLSVFFLGAY